MNSLSTLQHMNIVAGVLVALVVSITLAPVWLANRQNGIRPANRRQTMELPYECHHSRRRSGLALNQNCAVVCHPILSSKPLRNVDIVIAA